MFTRPLEPNDWARFSYYASKIRRIGGRMRIDSSTEWPAMANVSPNGIPWNLHPSIISDLNNYRPIHSFLPNLRYLLWSQWNEDMFPYIQAFLHGSLVNAVDLCPSYRPRNCSEKRLVHSVFSAVARLCPRVEYIDFMAGTPLESGHASQIILKLNHLRGLNCDSILTCAAFNHLAQLPDLWRSGYRFEADYQHIALKVTTDLPFRSLRDLFLQCRSVNCLLPLLKPLFTQCPLGRLIIHFDILDPLPLFQSLLPALSTARWAAEIEFLQIEGIDGSTEDWQDSHSTMSDFNPLLSMTNLQTLIVRLPIACDMDDDFLSKVPNHWPMMQRLDLRPWTEPRPETRLFSLNGILPLIRGCPNLTSLALTLDARLKNGDDFKPQFEHPSMKALLVVFSPIDDSVKVFEYLSNLFPNLETVEDLLQVDTWMEVDHLLLLKRGHLLRYICV